LRAAFTRWSPLAAEMVGVAIQATYEIDLET
jgi:hypothetical protein